MTIQFNTDKNIEGNDRLAAYVTSTLEESLDRFSSEITRIEVHISDENGSKAGQNDKRCMLEARLENRQPIAVTSHGATIEKAVKAAIDKLKASLETVLGKLKNY